MAALLTACGGDPKARFVASPVSGQAPLTVSFTNTSQNADEFQWDFGDGANLTTWSTGTSIEEPVSHEYTKAGTYTVTLTAILQREGPEFDVATVLVTVEPGTPTPTATPTPIPLGVTVAPTPTPLLPGVTLTPTPAPTVTLARPTPTATSAAVAVPTPTVAGQPTESLSPVPNDAHLPAKPVDPPVDLTLPFSVTDVRGSNGFISPFGIIRHSRDAGHGHGGIDIPLQANALVFAVDDGIVLSSEESSDGAGGFDVKLLISGSGGEGWGFLYEHVTLEPTITDGSKVTKGQLIARNGLTTDRRNSHFQLTYLFNSYMFSRDDRCWADHLNAPSKKSLLDYFDSIKTTEEFRAQWETATEEGAKAYKELLNGEKYPEGAQLCYRLGLDVRVPG